MHVPWTAEFAREHIAYALAFTCDECGFFDAGSDTCCHGWPTALHRRSRYQSEPPPREIVFCKEFELA